MYLIDSIFVLSIPSETTTYQLIISMNFRWNLFLSGESTSRWMVFFFCPNVLDWQAEVSLGVMSRFLGIHTFETSKILCSPETNVLIWYLREGAYIIFKKLFHLTWLKQANLVNFKDKSFINSCRNYQRQKKEKKIFVAKTFQIKRKNCIIFQMRDKYA